MTKCILITGGSGLIGTRLTEVLLRAGYAVRHLSRSRKERGAVPAFVWDPDNRKIEAGALDGVHAVIHLAGAGIADKRWDEARKQVILKSRTETARLLRDTLKAQKKSVEVFVSASGISWYGLENAAHPFTEDDAPANDFMAQVAVAWEQAADEMSVCAHRIVKLRTGVVLTSEGGALEKLAMPVRFFVGAPLGSGRQYINWIHIEDLCRMYLQAVEDPAMAGTYNAVSPQPVTNALFTEKIARTLHKPLWMPRVPGFVVRLVAGGVAQAVLEGGRISSAKIERTGFTFRFAALDAALKDLLI